MFRAILSLCFLATTVTLIPGSAACAEEHSLKKVTGAPSEVPPQMAGLIATEGVKLVGPDGALCEIWLLKKLAVQPNFSATLSVNYPLTPGQLVGVMRVPKGTTYHDFRGQEISGGVYTLRYGRQPEDGNHIGTSDLYDFLLALPAAVDKAPAVIGSPDELSANSAQAAGSSHPAIFSLLPHKDVKKSATLNHDEDRDFWTVDLITAGTKGDAEVKVPLRLVVVGQSEI